MELSFAMKEEFTLYSPHINERGRDIAAASRPARFPFLAITMCVGNLKKIYTTIPRMNVALSLSLSKGQNDTWGFL